MDKLMEYRTKMEQNLEDALELSKIGGVEDVRECLNDALYFLDKYEQELAKRPHYPTHPSGYDTLEEKYL